MQGLASSLSDAGYAADTLDDSEDDSESAEQVASEKSKIYIQKCSKDLLFYVVTSFLELVRKCCEG